MVTILAAFALLSLAPVPPGPDSGFSLTIVHVNDIHGHLDPTPHAFKVHGERPEVPLGGAAVLKTAFDSLRRAHPQALFLHAGDEFTGTAWFSRYQGLADAPVLQRLGFDAFVPGNHEFDQGPKVLRAFLDSARIPVVGANLDASAEPALAGRIPPALVRVVDGHRVGIVGIAHPGTPRISHPGQNLRFASAASVATSVDSLRKAGVEVVILLSHAGIEEDTVLARTVPGVSAIVGGHSHTRMGSFPGLGSRVPYPVVVLAPDGRRVPVVQAWDWGREVGVVTLRFDGDSRLRSWEGEPFLPSSAPSPRPGSVRTFAPDTGMRNFLAALSRPLDSLRAIQVARLPRDLTRGEKGDLVDLCARSLLEAGASQGAQVGIVNRGGVRADLEAGPLDMEQVLRVAPFQNTVCVVAITGAELRRVLHALRNHGEDPGVAGLAGDRTSQGKWERIRLWGASHDLADNDSVRVATNSYLAGGAGGARALRESQGFRLDTGIRDADALAALLSRLYPVGKSR